MKSSQKIQKNSNLFSKDPVLKKGEAKRFYNVF